MKKKLFKTLGIIACAVLLIGGSIAGTYAYLTSTATTQNTFTVGNVKITLNESYNDELGSFVEDEYSYKLIPGRTYIKDPTINVLEGSEDCYLFVKIEDGISGIQDTKTIATQLADNGWKVLGGEGNDVVYYYTNGNSGNPVTERTSVNVFSSFKILGSVKNEDLEAYASARIVVTAYAVQADGFEDVYDAWAHTFGASTNS